MYYISKIVQGKSYDIVYIFSVAAAAVRRLRSRYILAVAVPLLSSDLL